MSESMKNEPILALDGIVRTFHQGDRTLEVLRGVDLVLRPGEIVALVGQSGSGKSTLLHIAGLLERPDGGEIKLEGVRCNDLDDSGRTEMRRKQIGFVYQHHHLLAEFSALENVMLPQLLNGLSKAEARERSEQLLKMVGLQERADHRPGKLSGGEQQRVAIARAVANVPRLLLADEPTGNLDQQTAERVFNALITLVRGTGIAALVATHNPDLAARMDRTVRLRDGVLSQD
jgi:lipoprotein-releasing system ATP-binding protein